MTQSDLLLVFLTTTVYIISASLSIVIGLLCKFKNSQQPYSIPLYQPRIPNFHPHHFGINNYMFYNPQLIQTENAHS